MYNAFWRHALFVRGQSFSFKTFDRSGNGCQVIGEGAGNDFRGPSVQALPLPSRVSFSRARFFLCPQLPSACYAGYPKHCVECLKNVANKVILEGKIKDAKTEQFPSDFQSLIKN